MSSLSKWEQFAHLGQTYDSLARERHGLKRWLQMPFLTFLIPLTDPAVIAQLVEWQQAFQSQLAYEPMPVEHLHITLHHVGFLRLRPWFWLPNLWRRSTLPRLVERTRPVFESFYQFEIGIGPLNAFPNVLIADVHDDKQCLHMLRAKVRRALPLRARPSMRWKYVPHITLGYWGEQDAAPLAKAIEPYRSIDPIPMTVTHVRFTIYTRHHLPLARYLTRDATEEVIAEFALKPRE